MLLILDDGSEYLGPRSVVPEVFFDSIPDLERDVYKHSLSVPSEIVAFKAVDRG